MKKLFQLLTVGLITASFTACERKDEVPGGGGVTTPTDETTETTVESSGPPKEGTATLKGAVTLTGTPPTMPPLRMDAKPECAAQHDTTAVAEVVVTGPGGALAVPSVSCDSIDGASATRLSQA